MLEPYPYQREGAGWLTANASRNAVLADEMGLGKTGQAIIAADLLGIDRILVLCPGIARQNWSREFAMWQRRMRSVSVVEGQKSKANTDVVIASYSGLQSRPVLLQLINRNWDLIIADEAHALKNKDSLATQIVYGADCTATKGLASKAKRVWLLSGTIMPNGPHEMWTHTKALFPQALQGQESYNSWIDHFCVYTIGKHGNHRVWSPKNVDDFVHRLRPYIKRRLVKDVLPDLPPLRFGHVTVQPDYMPPKSLEIEETEQVLRAALATVNPDLGIDEFAALRSVDAMHIASLAKWTAIAKAPAIADLLKNDLESGLDRVVVFARHTEVFRILKEKLPEAEAIIGSTPMARRQEIIDRFQGRAVSQPLRVLLCSIDIASTALTLTASSNVVFAETGWVPKDVIQAAKRCHRIGQTQPVLARIVSLNGSLDEVMNDTIVHKYRNVSKIESQFVG